MFEKQLKKEKVSEIMASRASAAWSGIYTPKVFATKDKSVQIEFKGTVYEPSYECFEGGCNVYCLENGEEKCLYSISDRNVAPYRNEKVETGSVEDVLNFVEKYKMYEV